MRYLYRSLSKNISKKVLVVTVKRVGRNVFCHSVV